jgi:hypothetical protein
MNGPYITLPYIIDLLKQAKKTYGIGLLCAMPCHIEPHFEAATLLAERGGTDGYNRKDGTSIRKSNGR